MISIIGAGPIGNYVGSLLAQKGFSVTVFEEHKKIGVPIQCTGITTFFLSDIMKIDKSFMVNTINRTRVYAPNMDSVDISLKKNFVFDRTKFDSYLAEQAQSAGVKYKVGHKYVGCKQGEKLTTHFTNGNSFACDTLIGADGPLSQVAKTTHLYGQRKFIVGHQARVKISCEEDLVEFFLGEGYFGWLVPESNKVARLGICSMGKAKEYFDKLFSIRRGEILEWQSGIIPLYDPKLSTEKDNVYLVGDAATQVKATTLGGIIPGMLAAEELNKALQEEKSYQRLWKKRLGRELWVHLMLHQTMQKFKEKDYNRLIELVKQDRVRAAITEHDREFPSRLLLKLLLREPRFLQYAKFLVI